jgi:integrase
MWSVPSTAGDMPGKSHPRNGRKICEVVSEYAPSVPRPQIGRDAAATTAQFTTTSERTECQCIRRGRHVNANTAGQFDEFERLVEAARVIDQRTLLIVLFGGEAGLRCGEMIALEWGDVDLVNRQVCI